MSPTATAEPTASPFASPPESVSGIEPVQKNGSTPKQAGKASARKSAWRIVPIPVDRIDPNPFQPRLAFDPLEMADLVASVRVHGVQQPIIVRTCKADLAALQADAAGSNGHQSNGHSHAATSNGHKGKVRPNLVRYQLVAGERRLRACKEAGRRTIPAIIRDDLTDAQAAEMALLENIQRSNLTVIEEAAGYKRLMLEFRMKEERIAKKVGKSVATIRETLKLLQLPQAVQKLLAEKKLTAAHGRELLALAPFEKVCVLVAERVALDHLTALSLQATPLPNVVHLKSQRLLVELDWKTKFDWQRECGKCPHKAYVKSGYSSYCLRPDEWKQKQETSIARQQQEAARVLEEARRAGSTTVDTAQLPPSSFRDLSHATPPAGCSAQCPCRSETTGSRDPTKRVPICLNPGRYAELQKQERQAHEEMRRHKYLALWQQARDALKADMETRALGRVATLIALPILQMAFGRYGDGEAWANLARTVSASLGVYVPWDDLLDHEKPDGELYALLREPVEGESPEQLLLLCACLLLAYEANGAVRFAGETPRIDFVLGRTEATPPELDATEMDPAGLSGAVDEAARDGEDAPDEAGGADADASDALAPAPGDDVPSGDSSHAMDSAEAQG
jgi:ParB/RepB/Spo0J family partition protein